MTTRVILIGCGKAKRAVRSPARDLYTGVLFRARRRYAEASTITHGGVWRVLSAKLGVVAPDVWASPYNLRVEDLSGPARERWASGVLHSLREIAPLSELCVEVHAGRSYTMPLIAYTTAQVEAGPEWLWPLRGLSLGQQLGWYRQHASQVDLEEWLSAADGGEP